MSPDAELERPAVSVVVPVYNSEHSLPELCRRLDAVLAPLTRAYEVILVNDGSRDGSWATIARLCRELPRVHGICLMRNYGQHSALLCGVRAARYEITLTIDDDLQHPPEEIPRLLAALATGADVVYGTPQEDEHQLWRVAASRITKLALQSAMGVAAARGVSAFRAFRTQLRDAFADTRGGYISIDVLLTWGTVRFASVPVRHDPRLAGRSNYTFRKLVGHALNMMTGFSTLPLQAASLMGFLCTGLGLVVLAYVVVRYLLQGSAVPGFPFLASIIAIFSGAQLFALGIIGEYLARMHFRSMNRPAYVVRDDLAASRKTEGRTPPPVP